MISVPDYGDYAFTVWTCYGASIAVLLAFTIDIFVQKAKMKNGR